MAITGFLGFALGVVAIGFLSTLLFYSMKQYQALHKDYAAFMRHFRFLEQKLQLAREENKELSKRLQAWDQHSDKINRLREDWAWLKDIQRIW